MSKKVGLDGKLYYGTAGSTATNELTIVRDVTADIAVDEADASTRASGWKDYIPTMKDMTLTFDIVNDPSNAGYQALRAACMAGTPIALRSLDSASGEGPDADFCVYGFPRSEPLGDVQTISLTCKPTHVNRQPTWATS